MKFADQVTNHTRFRYLPSTGQWSLVERTASIRANTIAPIYVDNVTAKSTTVHRPSVGSGMRRSLEHSSLHLRYAHRCLVNPPFRLLFGAFFDGCLVKSGVVTNRDLETAKSATVQRPSAGSGMRRSFEHPSLHLPAHFTSRHASLARVSHRAFTFLRLIVQLHIDTKEINTFFWGLHLSNGT